jgi:hypothetical protein
VIRVSFKELRGPEPTVETLGHAELRDGRVVFDKTVAHLRGPILDPRQGRRVGREEGETYLRALPKAFRGSYFWAELKELPTDEGGAA